MFNGREKRLTQKALSTPDTENILLMDIHNHVCSPIEYRADKESHMF